MGGCIRLIPDDKNKKNAGGGFGIAICGGGGIFGGGGHSGCGGIGHSGCGGGWCGSGGWGGWTWL